jgi:hypothetical protein
MESSLEIAIVGQEEVRPNLLDLLQSGQGRKLDFGLESLLT